MRGWDNILDMSSTSAGLADHSGVLGPGRANYRLNLHGGKEIDMVGGLRPTDSFVVIQSLNINALLRLGSSSFGLTIQIIEFV